MPFCAHLKCQQSELESIKSHKSLKYPFLSMSIAYSCKLLAPAPDLVTIPLSPLSSVYTVVDCWYSLPVLLLLLLLPALVLITLFCSDHLHVACKGILTLFVLSVKSPEESCAKCYTRYTSAYCSPHLQWFAFHSQTMIVLRVLSTYLITYIWQHLQKMSYFFFQQQNGDHCTQIQVRVSWSAEEAAHGIERNV